MIPVIFDCDNTMGIYGKDVDDGLALLYLLGSENIDLIAITTTFGNSTLEMVHPNTQRILRELGREDIPLYKGAETPQNRSSEAAKALVDMVDRRPHELTILATGSVSNLMGAYDIDPLFFKKVKHIVMMGGIEYPLLVNGLPMKELNFASDPEAICIVLEQCHSTSIITGHVCLDAVFSHDTYRNMAKSIKQEMYDFIKKETEHWITFIGTIYNMNGFCNWDAVAAAYIDHPDLFDVVQKQIGHKKEDLETGLLIEDPSNGNTITLPLKIKNVDILNDILISAWANVKLGK